MAIDRNNPRAFLQNSRRTPSRDDRVAVAHQGALHLGLPPGIVAHHLFAVSLLRLRENDVVRRRSEKKIADSLEMILWFVRSHELSDGADVLLTNGKVVVRHPND